MQEKEAELIANLIADVIENKDNESKIKDIGSKVIKLCKEFPLYE